MLVKREGKNIGDNEELIENCGCVVVTSRTVGVFKVFLIENHRWLNIFFHKYSNNHTKYSASKRIYKESSVSVCTNTRLSND